VQQLFSSQRKPELGKPKKAIGKFYKKDALIEK
jgi:hypothetical protein